MSVLQTKTQHLFLTAIVLISTFLLTPQAEAMGKSIYDGAPTVDDCRKCHGDTEKQPHPLLQTSNVDRHHLLIGDPIEGFYDGYHESVAPGDTSEGVYNCMTCHEIENSTFTAPRDCLSCHPAWSVQGMPHRGTNVHHNTDAFKSRDCRACHGFLSSDGSSQGGMGRGGRMGGRR